MDMHASKLQERGSFGLLDWCWPFLHSKNSLRNSSTPNARNCAFWDKGATRFSWRSRLAFTIETTFRLRVMEKRRNAQRGPAGGLTGNAIIYVCGHFNCERSSS